jgi:anti-sigma regulatory factor (Ser/Thr protein kinase)
VSPADPFRHLALVHHDVDELVAGVAPLLEDVLGTGGVVWAAVDGVIREAVERHLGAASHDVVFGEPAQPYGYSGQTTASRRAARLRELLDGDRTALVLSDAATVGGPGPRASSAWCLVDASCNLALRGMPVTLVCLLAATDASEDADRFLSWNHPELVVGAVADPNPRHLAPEEVLAALPVPPAPALGPPTHTTAFEGVGALAGVRRATRRHGEDAGLAEEQVEGLVLAVSELVANSIEHGPGRGTLSWWAQPGRVVAEIHDDGRRMGTTTPGLTRPDVRSPRGRGVWLARQLSDVVHLWTGADGTHARPELAA